MTIMMSRKALESYGLVNLGNINWNLPPAVLIEHALARKEGELAANGAQLADWDQPRPQRVAGNLSFDPGDPLGSRLFNDRCA